MKFSELKKTDLALASFKDLEELNVPKKTCLVNDVHDIIDIRID